MARPNPGTIKPDRDRAYYVAAVTGLLQELDTLAYRMFHDHVLRHYQARSYAIATAYAARLYRACIALWFVLDLAHYKDYCGTLLPSFVDRQAGRRRTFHARARLQHEVKTRIVERLARVADQTPQTEAEWERAFAARQAAVAAIHREVADLTTRVRVHMMQDPDLHTPVFAALMHTNSVRAQVAKFARSLRARALADAIALRMPMHDRHDRWIKWVAKLIAKHHARTADDARIEASARANGYL